LTTYRVPRIAVALVAAAFVLPACGHSGGGSSAEDTTPPAAKSPNQDLRVAVGADPFLQGNPPNPNIGTLTNGPNPGIFETLTRLTSDFGLQPGLALRWESPSPQQWRFFLRTNVTFHNGAKFDAAAVVTNLETIAKRQTHPRGLDPGTAKAAAPDTVEINLTTPNTRLAEQLAGPSYVMMAPGTQPGAGNGDPANTPTGTGPFQFQTYTPGVSLVVKAYDGYWGLKPQLRSITFRFGPDADAGRLLATRQVDLVGQIPYESMPTVSGRTDHVVGSHAYRAEYLLLNTGGIDEFATLKDDNLRQAISLTIDRNAVRLSAWPDDGDNNDTVIPTPILADSGDRVKTPTQSTDQAKRLLDQAGWAPGADGVRAKNGTPLVLTLILARPPEQQAAAKVITNQLAAVGIGVKVVDPTPDTPFVRLNNASFDLFMASQVQDDANPCALCRFFSIRPGGQLSYASSVGGGPEADTLYDSTYTAPSDDTARRAAADIMNVVVAKRFTAVPLASLRTEWLISPRVRGFDPAALGGAQDWGSVWLTV
jgi:peptide/nickel transport system substrate-binding protein